MATVQAVRAHGNYDRTVMGGVGFGQGVHAAVGRYTFSAAVPIGTVIQSPMIQSGSTILDTLVIVTGGGSATYSVGNDEVPTYYASAAAGPVVRSSAATAAPVTLTFNDTVDVVTAGAVTAAAGTVTIVVTYLPRNG